MERIIAYFTRRIELFLLVGFVIVIAAFWNQPFVDDAYITFRFSRRLADGHLFQWNVGQGNIEGFSNPLWTLIASIPIALGFDQAIETVMFWVQIVFILALVWVLYSTTRQHIDLPESLSRFMAFLATAIMLAQPSFWQSALNGLEGSGYVFFIFVAYAFSVKSTIFTSRELIGFAAICAALSLSRFEGFAVVYAVLLPSFVVTLLRRDRDWRQDFKLLGVVTGAVITIFVLRYIIFSEWTPLTVQAKGGFFRELLNNQQTRLQIYRVEPALAYIRNFFNVNWGFWLIPVSVAVGIYTLRIVRLRIMLPALGVLVIIIMIVFANGGDWMAGHRLLAPLFPIGAFLVVYLVQDLVRLIADGVPPVFARFWTPVRYVLLVVIVGSLGLYLFRDLNLSEQSTQTGLFEDESTRGLILAECLASDDLYLTGRAGRIPYYSDLNTVDFHGLVTPCVTKGGNNSTYYGTRDDRCVLEMHPTVIEKHGWAHGIGDVAALAEDMGLEYYVMYDPLGSFSNYWQNFMVRGEDVDRIRECKPSTEFYTYEDWLEFAYDQWPWTKPTS